MKYIVEVFIKCYYMKQFILKLFCDVNKVKNIVFMLKWINNLKFE